MGFFDKIFKGAEDTWKNPGNLFEKPEQQWRKANKAYLSGDIKGFGKAAMQYESDKLALAAMSTQGPLYHAKGIFKDKEGETPPPVGESPGIGTTTNEAVISARRRVAAEAAMRRRQSRTITTTPLGLIGEGAPTSKKKLLGE